MMLRGRVYLKEEAGKKKSTSLRSRGYLAEEMPIGKTLETPVLRIHRFASSFRVTDLTNAGKRGKKVKQFALYDLDYVKEPKTLRLISQFASQIHRARTYKQAYAMAKGIVDEFEKHPQGTAPKLGESEHKGVDVEPYGSKDVIIDTPEFNIRSELNNFLVADKRDKMNEPRTMGPMNGRKTAAKKFRAWVLKNRKAIERMTYNQVISAMSKAGIDHHSWCAVD